MADPNFRFEHSMIDPRFEAKCSKFANDESNPIPSRLSWGVCVYQAFSDLEHTQSIASADVLYLFHPAISTEGFFSNLTTFQKALLESGKKIPTMISISFYDRNFKNVRGFATLQKILDVVYEKSFGVKSTNFLMLENGGSDFPLTGLSNVFTDEVMPWIEAQVGFDKKSGKRMVLGISMGGFNAIQLVLQPRTRSLFSRAVFLDPFNFEANPLDKESFRKSLEFNMHNSDDPTFGSNPTVLENSRLKKTLERIDQGRKKKASHYVDIESQMVRTYFGDDKGKFQKEYHAFGLLERAANKLPEIYLVTSTKDRPFYKPNCAFAQKLKTKKSNVYYSETDYGHGTGLSFHEDISESIADFVLGSAPRLNQTPTDKNCFLPR